MGPYFREPIMTREEAIAVACRFAESNNLSIGEADIVTFREAFESMTQRDTWTIVFDIPGQPGSGGHVIQIDVATGHAVLEEV
jgi:hypothetical protein